MTPLDVAAALTSALLHAGWNARVKASAAPIEAMTAQMVVGAVLVLPILAVIGLPDRAAWPWMAASTVMSLATVATLLRAWELGGFGVVYPVSRAISVLLVVPISTLIGGDRLGLAGFLGVGAIVVALGLLAFDRAGPHALSRRALAWTALAGLTTAAYVLCDAYGVRHAGSPWAYAFAITGVNALVMVPLRHRGVDRLRRLAAALPAAVPTAVAALTSYGLVLWVWGHAPVAPTSALRDTSAVFAVLIAVVWLKEPFGRTRLVAVVLAAAAVPLLRLA
ncbi:hypothetical protein EYW49_03935 [Siculibacillus lacustris]|uniref:EamA domain-containing protein n=1 Tax=Siculibacillus lacustris TaxID=1549641 RepID=A0A4Q9VVQ1_9HYPH|nr:EamA family transporter [Siculibacillus lacustris]TBW40342.1 hypothetical protein EYW49_03935 [Siculibacillus lacustris]